MVIANAGRGDTQLATRLTWEEVAPVIDLNVRGAFATLVAAIPVFVAQQRGHLVGISSLAGVRGLPTSAAYCASKAALSTFLESLRIDLAPVGIRVTDVQPGFVVTPAHAHAQHPMPFAWSADKAARHIARRLEHAPAVLAFPWPLALATRFARLLPAWLYDRAVRSQSPASS
jgi:short-subunit dehydrogenase